MAEKGLWNLAGDAISGGLEFLGALAYAQFEQLPDVPQTHSAYAESRLMESGFTPFKTQFRDSDEQRRIKAMEENASKYGINPMWIRAVEPLLRMMMRSDTPDARNSIRNSFPIPLLGGTTVGDAILELYDALTANEAGMNSLFSSLADTFGTAVENEGAAYAANLIANDLRSAELNDRGLRPVDASAMSATINAMQRTGYTFGQAAGLKSPDAISAGAAFGQAFSDMTSEDAKSARRVAAMSYLNDRIDRTSDKDEKALLTNMKDIIAKGGDITAASFDSLAKPGGKYATGQDILNAYNLPEEVKSYSMTHQADIQMNHILDQLSDLNANNPIAAGFRSYATAQGIQDIGSLDTKKQSALRNEYANVLINDLLKEPDKREYADVTRGTMLESDLAMRRTADELMGETREGIIREKNRIAAFAHQRLAVGTALWDQLPADVQQQYRNASPGAELSGAQAILGGELMDKYAHDRMRYMQYERAAAETLQLLEYRALANLPEAEMSKQVAFIGSIIQDKNNIGMAARAALAWRAAAKNAGVEMTPEMELENAQRFARFTDTQEGKATIMFLGQEFSPESEMGQLQAALRSQSLTDAQKERWEYLLQRPGYLYDEVARATDKTPNAIAMEVAYASKDALPHEWTENALTQSMQVLAHAAETQYITEETIGQVIGKGRVNRTEKIKLGMTGEYSKPKVFSKMLKNALDAGVNLEDFLMGRVNTQDIERLEEKGFTLEAKYARQRVELRNSIEGSEANKDIAMGGPAGTRITSEIFHGNTEFMRQQGKWTRLDPADTVREATSAADKDMKGAGDEKPSYARDPTEMASSVTGKNTSGAGSWLKSMFEPFGMGGLVDAVYNRNRANQLTAESVARIIESEPVITAFANALDAAAKKNNERAATDKPQQPTQ